MSENIQQKDKKHIFSSWKQALQHYFEYKGRISHFDFWAFMLVTLLMFLAWLGIVSYLQLNHVFLYVVLAYLSIPIITMSSKRLHDIGLSGKWVVPMFVLGLLTIVDWEYHFFNIDIMMFLLLSYCTYFLWLLGLEGNKFGNGFGPYVMEKNGQKTRYLLQHVSAGFLVGIWLAYFFHLFITK
jgi:uncharacterized membrane protein YhaH (DUF805 family)